ncbi:MAG: Methyltransferase type 11 [Parcubacteria group bacterium GW2011_GWB1_40_5]|nr:MAG: Methyltransferase type 11 [Parcubacteria group bacterium GW2011_GWB1_40_5]OHA86144.1 MAG: hypothetical protein A2123_03225 [Candidatus Zambryskibacteria bacterium GWB1_40_5]
MISKPKNWSTHPDNKITFTQKILSHISLKVREEQFNILWKLVKPTKKFTVLDVGVRADETLVDSNFFEKRYPYPRNLTAVSIEDVKKLRRKYSGIRFKRIIAGRPLPFKTNYFDVVVSWATIEHVGGRNEQQLFLNELFRVGRKVFITTPDRNFFYEPHSGLIFVHWFPHKYFSLMCILSGKNFWAKIENLNPLNNKAVHKLISRKKGTRVISYKMFGFFPTHLIVVKI